MEKQMSDKLKCTIRIPTDQYAFVEVQCEGTPEEIRATHDGLREAMTGKASDIDFLQFLNVVIDSNLTEWGTIDDYNVLTAKQQGVMQALKRLCKRLKYKHENKQGIIVEGGDSAEVTIGE